MSFELAAETLVCDCFVNKGQDVAMKTQQHNMSVGFWGASVNTLGHLCVIWSDFLIKYPSIDLNGLGYESAVLSK